MATSSKAEPPGGASLRLRMLLLAAAAIAITLAIAGVTLVAIFERHLDRRVAQELAVRLLELASGFEIDEQGQPTVARRLADPRYDQPYGGSYWQVAGTNGPLLRSRSLWDQELPWRGRFGQPSAAFATTGPRRAEAFMLDRDIRLTAGAFRIAVALDHAEMVDLRWSFAGDVLLALGVIGAVLILGAWVQIRLGLRPLAMLQQQLARIGSGRASRLAGPFPAEVAPLAGTLNTMIDRHEAAVQRARLRAGDLAHGLKTPLTILTGEAGRIEAAGLPASAESLREQIGYMRRHIERELARARTHGASTGGGTTDAPAMLARLLGLMRRMPRAEALTFGHSLADGTRLRMDPDDFGEAMGNLLDNARRWATAQVWVRADVAAGRVTLHVDDDGPGMPAARTGLRGESGAPPGEGNGLGLAIVGDILGQYETTLTIGTSPEGGCRVSFTLPGWVS